MLSVRLLLIAASAVVALGAITVSPATAAPSTAVVEVRAGGALQLQADGTITGSVRVRCASGWVAEEISATIVQGQSSASAFTVTSVPCDGHWYSVELTFVDEAGSFVPGKVTYGFLQFLVTNADSGDSAGAHDNGATVRLKSAA